MACEVGRGEKKCCTWGHDGTHDGRGGVIEPTFILAEFNLVHPNVAIAMSQGERSVLSRRVEMSGARDWRPSDITARQQRGTAVPFLDDLQSGGGSGRCVVHI